MLTADLVRARVRKGVVCPMYVRDKHQNATRYAEELCSLYAAADGWSRAALEDAKKSIIGDAPDFLIARGLAKLLDDRCEWAAKVAYSPQALRALLFDTAFGYGTPPASDTQGAPVVRPTREAVLAAVAAELHLDVQEIEDSMYGDHPDAERRVGYKKITSEALLRRYDVALAQAVLLRATAMTITIEKASSQQIRALVAAMKFRQLLFRAYQDADGKWVLHVDGPLSVLHRATRYGLQLALLIPVLLHVESWRLEATVEWPKAPSPLRFLLGSEDQLKPYRRWRGMWISEEQKLLESRIVDHKTAWTLERSAVMFPLGHADLLAPDLTLKHPDGRRVFVEVVGSWRKKWLQKRLRVLKQYGPPNTVVCVSRHLAADKESLTAFEGAIVEYAHVISLTRLLDAAERVGIVM